MAGADDDARARGDLEKDGEEIHAIRLLLIVWYSQALQCSDLCAMVRADDQDLAPLPFV